MWVAQCSDGEFEGTSGNGEHHHFMGRNGKLMVGGVGTVGAQRAGVVLTAQRYGADFPAFVGNDSQGNLSITVTPSGIDMEVSFEHHWNA